MPEEKKLTPNGPRQRRRRRSAPRTDSRGLIIGILVALALLGLGALLLSGRDSGLPTEWHYGSGSETPPSGR